MKAISIDKCKYCGKEAKWRGFCNYLCKDSYYNEKEINELEADNKQLREALEKIVLMYDKYNNKDLQMKDIAIAAIIAKNYK